MGPKLLVGGGPERRLVRNALGCEAEPQFFGLLEKIHIEIAARLQPTFMRLRRRSTDEPQTAGPIREDPHRRILRLIASLKRSSILVDFMCLWCCKGSR